MKKLKRLYGKNIHLIEKVEQYIKLNQLWIDPWTADFNIEYFTEGANKGKINLSETHQSSYRNTRKVTENCNRFGN